MIEIKEITSKSLKTKLTLKIMSALPEWFSPPSDILKKSIEHRNYPLFAAYQNRKCVGLAVLKIHNEYTAEIYNLGILPQVQRCGVGHMLLESCIQYCQAKNIYYLTAKTLDESADNKPYVRTRAFYKKEGFLPLEVLKNYWNKDNPCLFLIKDIKKHDKKE